VVASLKGGWASGAEYDNPEESSRRLAFQGFWAGSRVLGQDAGFLGKMRGFWAKPVEAPRQEEDDFGAHCCELPLFAALSFFQDLEHGGGSNYSGGSVLFQAEESLVARH
jgi:hypothetical protein